MILYLTNWARGSRLPLPAVIFVAIEFQSSRQRISYGENSGNRKSIARPLSGTMLVYKFTRAPRNNQRNQNVLGHVSVNNCIVLVVVFVAIVAAKIPLE